MSVSQYAAAFLDRLEFHRFVLCVQLSRWELQVQADYCQWTTYSGWFCRRIRFGGRGATWLWTCSQETDTRFFHTEEVVKYEFLLSCMIVVLQRCILNGDRSWDLDFSHADFCCFDYPFPTAWSATRCNNFQDFLNFEHWSQKRTSLLPIVVSWYCIEAYLIPGRNRRQSFDSVDCSEWRGLETHRVLHVTTHPVFSYNFSWVLERSFGHLTFTATRGVLTVSAAIQVLPVASNDASGFFRVDDRVQEEKPLLVALRLLVFFFTDVMGIRKLSITILTI